MSHTKQTLEITEQLDTFCMIVEQTREYKNRIIYNKETDTFTESNQQSLMSARNFQYPYGWIEGSGTPPEEHWDCILMSDKDYKLGDRVAIKVIGVFKRSDNDNKYICVEKDCKINDIGKLPLKQIKELKTLYTSKHEGDEWGGHIKAYQLMKSGIKAL